MNEGTLRTVLLTRRQAVARTGLAALAALVRLAPDKELAADRLAEALAQAVAARSQRGDLPAALALLEGILGVLRPERERPGLTAARSELLLAALHARIQIALDHREVGRVSALLAEADATVALAPASVRSAWRARLTHARGRQDHNAHRFARAARLYRAAQVACPGGTLLRDLGSALSRLGAEAPARDCVLAAARWWQGGGDSFQAARCESLLFRLDAEVARRARRPGKVEAALARLLDLERREPGLSAARNPLAHTQHRLNVLPALALADRGQAERAARACVELAQAHGYHRQAFELAVACRQLGLNAGG